MAELALGDSLWNQVCFHSHQATEKSLKALVASTGSSPPKTHRLADLLTFLEELPLLQGLEDELFSLESYYIPTRYPDALPGTLPWPPSHWGGQGGTRDGREDARCNSQVCRKLFPLNRLSPPPPGRWRR